MLTYFYLKSMKIDGNITYISSNTEFSDIEFVFSESPFLLNTKVCKTGEISVLPDDFSFTLSGDFNFTGDPCQDSQVLETEDEYFSFYTSSLNETFQIFVGEINPGNLVFMNILKDNGDWVYFEETRILVVDEETKDTFVIFPNPVTDILNIYSSEKKDVSFKLMNLNGSIVAEGFGSMVSTENVPTGIYFLEIENDVGEIQVEKIIKR